MRCGEVFLKSDPVNIFNFQSDVAGIDYQNYPTPTIGRFSVAYAAGATQGTTGSRRRPS